MFDKAKTYKTRDGREVRIYATDGGGSHGIHGAVFTKMEALSSWEWIPCQWNSITLKSSLLVDDYNLVEVKPRVKIEKWVNIYPRGGGLTLQYATKELADKNAYSDRFACVKIVIDCEEGEGL